MSYLDSEELSVLQSDVEVLMTDTAIIMRPSNVSDGQGGHTQSWAPVGTVNCRLEALRIRGVSELGGELPEATREFYIIMPPGTDVRAIDRVTACGSTHEVLNVWAPRSDEITRRILCKTLNAGGAV